jgi:hypothetical protein
MEYSDQGGIMVQAVNFLNMTYHGVANVKSQLCLGQFARRGVDA